MIKTFIQELDSVLVSMEEMTVDMTDGFSNQIIEQRPLSTKLMTYLPKFMQSKSTRSQNEKLIEY